QSYDMFSSQESVVNSPEKKSEADEENPTNHGLPTTDYGLNISNVPHEYTLIDSSEKRKNLIEQLLQQKEICFDTETTGVDATDCDIVGLSFSFEKHKGFYIPFPENREDAKNILHEFKSFF